MSSVPAQVLSITSRVVIAGACCFGIWASWNVARADYLFRLDTEESIRSAMHLEPDSWRYPMRLSQFDDAHAEQLLKRSLQLDSYNAPADIELGLYAESAGNDQLAEKLLLDAFAIDHTYSTRWALANFYFRRGNEDAFWKWAASAAKLSAYNSGALFDLCWRESTDPDKISNEILTNNPRLIRQYVDFLFARNQFSAAASAAQRLIQDGDSVTDTPQVLTAINRLVAANDGGPARELWRSLIARQWIKADPTLINNPDFARDPLPVSFDWNLPANDGLNAYIGPTGLESEFTGRQPENCTIAEQYVVLSPGSYSLKYAYRTSEIPANAGLKWQVVNTATGKSIAESPDLFSEAAKSSTSTFSVPPEAPLLDLRLSYQRPLGTVRISGRLVIASVQIQSNRQ